MPVRQITFAPDFDFFGETIVFGLSGTGQWPLK